MIRADLFKGRSGRCTFALRAVRRSQELKQKDRFRYAEKWLYGYTKNLACLDTLRGDLQIYRAGSDVHAQNYGNPLGFSGEPSSPVHAYVVSMETLEERIKYLERWTAPITRLINDLNGTYSLTGSKNTDLLQILKLMYIGENPPKQIKDELKISDRTFTRRRRDLVKVAIGYLGL